MYIEEHIEISRSVLILGLVFFFPYYAEDIFISHCFGFLLVVVVGFVSLFCQSRPFFSIVTENTQGRTENVFLTTGVFNHCSNESRQPIHSASLKMYIGIFDFFFPQRDILAQEHLVNVKWELRKGNPLASVRLADCDMLSSS